MVIILIITPPLLSKHRESYYVNPTPLLCSGVGLVLSRKLSSDKSVRTKEDKHYIAENKTNKPHNDTNFGHILLFYQSC